MHLSHGQADRRRKVITPRSWTTKCIQNSPDPSYCLLPAVNVLSFGLVRCSHCHDIVDRPIAMVHGQELLRRHQII